ncbi:MAG: DUF4920 domain-containing protein [Flavobacteriales bacterium]|nr:DUF4920 domain-containing protein [Flavobacteriales bacterium]
MKHLFFLLLAPAAITVQAQEPATAAAPTGKYTSYGDAITPDGAMSMAEFEAAAARTDSLGVKLAAEILGSCSKKGCWMNVKMTDGTPMMVRFRDYGFFVPKGGLEGKLAVLQGRARKEETSVSMLRHYAEDAGKSKEEIAAITQPQISWKFEADGVLIKE